MTTFANITCSTLLVSMLIAGADAGFRVRGGGASGVSRISARGVLKVRPHTKSGGVVNFRSDIRKVGGGGGGGQFASGPIRKVGGRDSLQVRYEKWGGGGGDSLQTKSGGGGGGQSTSGPIYEKWGGGGGGGGGQSTSGPIPLFGTQKISTCTYLRTT